MFELWDVTDVLPLSSAASVARSDAKTLNAFHLRWLKEAKDSLKKKDKNLKQL